MDTTRLTTKKACVRTAGLRRNRQWLEYHCARDFTTSVSDLLTIYVDRPNHQSAYVYLRTWNIQFLTNPVAAS